MAFENQLRENALVDVLPVEARRALAAEGTLLQISQALGLIVSGGVDGLYFDGDKAEQFAAGVNDKARATSPGVLVVVGGW